MCICVYVCVTAEDEADQLLSVFEEPQIVRSNAMMPQVSVRCAVLLLLSLLYYYPYTIVYTIPTPMFDTYTFIHEQDTSFSLNYREGLASDVVFPPSANRYICMHVCMYVCMYAL